jgi:hypothetical protein
VNVKDPELRRWGAFTITYKPKGGEFGSWQAACMFHRKSNVTDCKRSMKVEGPLLSDHMDVINKFCEGAVIKFVQGLCSYVVS